MACELHSREWVPPRPFGGKVFAVSSHVRTEYHMSSQATSPGPPLQRPLSPSMQHTYSPSGASFAPVYVSLCAWPTILAHNCFCICFPRRPSASCRKSLELPLHCPPVCCTVRGSRRHSIRAYFVHIFPTTSFIFLSAEMFLTRCCIFSASARHLGFSIFIPGPGLNVFTKETYYHLT